MLTPVFSDEDLIVYSPKFSFINLAFTNKSGIISKIYSGEKLIKEDRVENENIENYLTQEHKLRVE
jgi:hypothetical protein